MTVKTGRLEYLLARLSINSLAIFAVFNTRILLFKTLKPKMSPVNNVDEFYVALLCAFTYRTAASERFRTGPIQIRPRALQHCQQSATLEGLAESVAAPDVQRAGLALRLWPKERSRKREG